MKTIRLLYPDYVSGGLETYYFGAHLMAHILPKNERQPLVRVKIAPPDGREKRVTDGIYGKEEVLAGIREAMKVIEEERPDRIITIGGNCMVSQAPFDYLHGRYANTGDHLGGCPSGRLHGKRSVPQRPRHGAGISAGVWGRFLSDLMKNRKFQADEILYVGLQGTPRLSGAVSERHGGRLPGTDRGILCRRKRCENLWIALTTFWCTSISMYWIRRCSTPPILPTPELVGDGQRRRKDDHG